MADKRSQDGDGGVRLDKWLWAARFFKTRSQAHEAIGLGRVFVDGLEAKPSRTVTIGQTLVINSPRGRYEVVVREVRATRGSATVAAEMFTETEQSRIEREQHAEMRRLARSIAPPERPNTQERRQIRRLKEGD